jgi:hypothetical protein
MTTTQQTFSPTSFKPGQVLTCVVETLPRSHGEETTLERLMRRDPANKRALRRAQRMRGQRINVYNRGNRDWTSREKPARVVRVDRGVTWTMEFTPDIASDLASVARCISVKPAK